MPVNKDTTTTDPLPDTPANKEAMNVHCVDVMSRQVCSTTNCW
jgi:hypothetical protein